MLKLSGAYWLEDGQILETKVGNLTAKILCRRHNEALSPLDAEAEIFFQALLDTLADTRRQTISRKPVFHLASGEALELWMLKVACGHYFGIGSHNGVRLEENFLIDRHKVEKALILRKWESKGGLYLKRPAGDRLELRNEMFVGALLDESQGRMIGVRMGLIGFEMHLLLEAQALKADQWAGLAWRPTEIIWKQGQRFSALILSWPINQPDRIIRFGRYHPGS